MDATATRNLEQPVVDDGIRWLNFFNGRVLSAEDLRTDHDAIAEARRQLGRGIGSGIVSGLEVSEAVLVSSAGAPILTVKKGLAFNDDGQALELRRDITVGLVRIDAPTGSAGDDFSNCDVVLPGTTGLGVYVLTVGPASSDAGKAAVAGLGNSPASCNTAYSVEGVRLRLFPVPLEDGDLDEPDLLRNRIAYRMFGGADDASITEPFGRRESPSTLFDEMRRSCFESTDVPVALLYWEPVNGVQFVDEWSVRRTAAPSAASAPSRSPLQAARVVQREAAVFQFQAHLRDILRRVARPEVLAAEAHFEYLPPVGVLPLGVPPARGYGYREFFASQPTRGPSFIEGTHLRGLFLDGLSYAPINLSRGEVIWLYEIRENRQRVEGASGPRATPCVVFSTGHLRYRADARFELAYWNYASYAEIG